MYNRGRGVRDGDDMYAALHVISSSYLKILLWSRMINWISCIQVLYLFVLHIQISEKSSQS